MPSRILASHEIAALPAAGQINAYADRLESTAQGAELAGLQIAPHELRTLARDSTPQPKRRASPLKRACS